MLLRVYLSVALVLGAAASAVAQAPDTPAESPAASPSFWPESLLFGMTVGRTVPIASRATAGTDLSFVGGPPRREGLSPTVSLGWFSTDVVGARSDRTPAAQFRVRPVMAGVAYGQRVGTVLIEYRAVAGYAFNSMSTPDDPESPWHRSRVEVGGVTDIDNSLAWSLGLRAWRELLPRVHGVVGLSYVHTRPTLRLTGGRDASWKADRVLFEAGAAWEWRFR